MSVFAAALLGPARWHEGTLPVDLIDAGCERLGCVAEIEVISS